MSALLPQQLEHQLPILLQLLPLLLLPFQFLMRKDLLLLPRRARNPLPFQQFFDRQGLPRLKLEKFGSHLLATLGHFLVVRHQRAVVALKEIVHRLIPHVSHI